MVRWRVRFGPDFPTLHYKIEKHFPNEIVFLRLVTYLGKSDLISVYPSLTPEPEPEPEPIKMAPPPEVLKDLQGDIWYVFHITIARDFY